MAPSCYHLLLAAESPSDVLKLLGGGYAQRIAVIIAIAFASHLFVRLIRWLLQRYVRLHTGAKRRSKVLTLAHFVTSTLIFVAYFVACGMILREVNVPLTAYVASATVIGFAVSFGSQSVIQDVISGLTLITSDLLDVGDMVDIGGQAGVVQRVGIRFAVLTNFTGAKVFISNRNVANVINYERGYIRAFLDVRLPGDPSAQTEVVQRLEKILRAVTEQFSGLMLREFEAAEPTLTDAGFAVTRIKFRIWPGQGALIETVVKQAVLNEMKSIDPNYADWMVCVQYRVENDDVLGPAVASRRGRVAPPDARS